jgi:hypothetical protein
MPPKKDDDHYTRSKVGKDKTGLLSGVEPAKRQKKGTLVHGEGRVTKKKSPKKKVFILFVPCQGQLMIHP